jgi:hypothetical protein
MTVAKSYVSKYLTKGWQNMEAEELRKLSRARIVSVSQDMPPIFNTKSDWELCEYDIPSKDTIYNANRIIKILLKKGATFITCEKRGNGFKIESDKDFSIKELYDETEKYIWNYCNLDDFDYLYGNEQLYMNL